jgi:hypothetical protein
MLKAFEVGLGVSVFLLYMFLSITILVWSCLVYTFNND